MRTESLRKLSLFASLDDEALASIASEAVSRVLEPGEIIFREGSLPDEATKRFYFVIAGSVKLTKHSPSGKDTVVKIVSVGEPFGLSPVFTDEPFPVTAVSAEKCRIGMMRPEKFIDLTKRHPDIMLRLVLNLFERLHMTQDMLHSVAVQPAIQRVARIIIYFAKRGGTIPTKDGEQLYIRLPHETIAGMVGISYEESVRAIASLKKLCLRYRRGGIITITNRLELEALAEG